MRTQSQASPVTEWKTMPVTKPPAQDLGSKQKSSFIETFKWKLWGLDGQREVASLHCQIEFRKPKDSLGVRTGSLPQGQNSDKDECLGPKAESPRCVVQGHSVLVRFSLKVFQEIHRGLL